VVIGSGVLVGTGAVVVDVGQIYVERQELQSGADSAALALATSCARNPLTCVGQAATAQRYVDANASDGHTRVTQICGTGRGLPACTTQPTNLTGCVGAPPNAPYVEVRTATETEDGSTLLPPSFAGALSGNHDYQGSTILACARAEWGTPGTATGLAVTISTCVWNQLTHNGGTLSAPPPAAPTAGSEGVIYLHGTHNAGSCPAGPSGWQAPGGFSWLDELAGPCRSTVSAGGTYGGNTGVSASGNCESALIAARANRTVLPMAVFDGVRGTGAGTTYHLDGFSAFVVTGFHLPGLNQPSTLSGGNLCTGSDKCIYGYFTSALLPSATLSDTATNYGTSVAALVG
jgi:hypothetical protein